MSASKVLLGDAYWFQEGPGVRNWQFTDHGIKLLNVANITKKGQLDLDKTSRYLAVDEVQNRYRHFLADEGDLVIASSGISIDVDGFLRTRGAFVRAEHLPLCMNTSTIRFKAKDGLSDLGFFRHWLDSHEFRSQITKEVTGIAQKNFGPSHLARIVVSLPPLPEQRRIAAILDKADALRTKRREAIDKLDQLLQSVFLEMFGDPVMNPKGWPISRLADLGTLDRGVSRQRPRGAPELLGGEHPLIQTGDVARSGGYIREFTATYSDAGLAQSKKWPAGTLCITIAANIADTGILTFDACFPDSVVGFTANQNSNAEFIQMLMNFLREILEEKAPKVAQKNINLAILRELPIPVPPIELQCEWRKFAVRVEHMKQSLHAATVCSDKLFGSIQQNVFAGTL